MFLWNLIFHYSLLHALWWRISIKFISCHILPQTQFSFFITLTYFKQKGFNVYICQLTINSYWVLVEFQRCLWLISMFILFFSSLGMLNNKHFHIYQFGQPSVWLVIGFVIGRYLNIYVLYELIRYWLFSRLFILAHFLWALVY